MEDLDDEDLGGPIKEEPMDEEEDFTPAPQRSPRRQTRRKTTQVSALREQLRAAVEHERVRALSLLRSLNPKKHYPRNLYRQRRRVLQENEKAYKPLEKITSLLL